MQANQLANVGLEQRGPFFFWQGAMTHISGLSHLQSHGEVQLSDFIPHDLRNDLIPHIQPLEHGVLVRAH
jgi:hypothetical protein